MASILPNKNPGRIFSFSQRQFGNLDSLIYRAGHEKETVDVTLENDFKPVGVHYVHTRNFKDNQRETVRKYFFISNSIN